MRSVGVDTGGTFTDFLILEGERVRVEKVPSTPEDPARSILQVAAEWDDCSQTQLVHGSTVATNTLLERRGARVAWVTTRGFADVIEIGRQDRRQIYRFDGSAGGAAQPVVPRELRFEVNERIAAGGKVVEPLDEGELVTLVDALRDLDIEAVAVGFLFSPENAVHERRAGELLSELGVPVVESAQVHPELREYERFSTATISAYVAPQMDRYLSRLARELGVQRFRVMESSGGVMPWQRIRNQAARTVLSGPAGGVVAAQQLASRRAQSLVTFDMGGTSTDVSLVVAGELSRTHDFCIDGLPVAVPVVDVETVGAGGGSLVWVDAGGALRVGPESAGADPGPICYGRGGSGATVTDANLLLGRLPQSTRLGGKMPLQLAGVAEAFTKIGASFGWSALQVAHGVIQVVEAEMERALRRITQERGVDPRGLSLVSFGGAGGLHAVSLARSLGMSEVWVPTDPGILSAAGMLLAPEVEHVTLATSARLNSGFLSELGDRCAVLEAPARQRLHDSGHAPEVVEIERKLALRYVGQSHTLDVAWQGDCNPQERFYDLYAQRYGGAEKDRPVEVTAVKSRVFAPGLSQLPRRIEEAAEQAPTKKVPLFLAGSTTPQEVPCLQRSQIREPLLGPAVIEETSSTFWLPEHAMLHALDDGTLRVACRA